MIHDERIETMRDNYDDHGAELVAKDSEMSDIVKRLRSVYAAGPTVGSMLDPIPDPLTNEAADEIERLRQQRDQYSNVITGELMPKIERLRGELRKQPAESLVVLDLKEQLMSKNAELKRLRLELGGARASSQCVGEGWRWKFRRSGCDYEEARAEIELLRTSERSAWKESYKSLLDPNWNLYE